VLSSQVGLGTLLYALPNVKTADLCWSGTLHRWPDRSRVLSTGPWSGGRGTDNCREGARRRGRAMALSELVELARPAGIEPAVSTTHRVRILNRRVLPGTTQGLRA